MLRKKASPSRLYPIRPGAYTDAQARAIGRDILVYLTGTARDEEVGGADLVAYVLESIDAARRGGQ